MTTHAHAKELTYCGITPGDTTSTAIPAAPQGATLVQAQVLIRHGDRLFAGNTRCWHGDTKVWDCSRMTTFRAPHHGDSNATHVPAMPRIFQQTYLQPGEWYRGSCGVGQLTSKGFEQQQTNGAILRKAYVGSLLSAELTHSELHLRSDDSHRTIQSGQALVNGMYPTTTTTQATEVVPFFWMDHATETIVANPKRCPGLTAMRAEALASPAFSAHVRAVTEPLEAEIALEMGIPQRDVSLSKLFDCMLVHHCHGDSLPISPSTLQRLHAEISWQQFYLYSYPNATYASTLTMGPLIAQLLGRMNAQVTKQKAAAPLPKFLLYSGHDTTLMPVASAFNFSGGVWSPYASLIAFELYTVNSTSSSSSSSSKHGSSEQHAVRIVYNGKVQRLPACSGLELCPFEQFAKIAGSMVPSVNQCPGPYAAAKHGAADDDVQWRQERERLFMMN
jgi:hypothetical protein